MDFTEIPEQPSLSDPVEVLRTQLKDHYAAYINKIKQQYDQQVYKIKQEYQQKIKALDEISKLFILSPLEGVDAEFQSDGPDEASLQEDTDYPDGDTSSPNLKLHTEDLKESEELTEDRGDPVSIKDVENSATSNSLTQGPGKAPKFITPETQPIYAAVVGYGGPFTAQQITSALSSASGQDWERGRVKLTLDRLVNTNALTKHTVSTKKGSVTFYQDIRRPIPIEQAVKALVQQRKAAPKIDLSKIKDSFPNKKNPRRV